MPEYQALRDNPWFAHLPAALADAVLDCGRLQKLAPGMVLFRRGDPPGDWYAVCSGAIKASSTAADGSESILAVLEPGNWFGEIALLDGGPRVHDATAVGPSTVLAVPAAAFARFMQDATFATALARLMASPTKP